MLCPKCYGKIDKNTNRCKQCGFKMQVMDGASNKEAKKIKRTIYKDDIMYTTDVPFDVSKKSFYFLLFF